MGKCPLFLLFPFAANLIMKTEEIRCSETSVSTGCLCILFLITVAVARCNKVVIFGDTINGTLCIYQSTRRNIQDGLYLQLLDGYRHFSFLAFFRIQFTCVWLVILYFFFFPNGRYIDCSSLTYATNKSKTLKFQYRY